MLGSGTCHDSWKYVNHVVTKRRQKTYCVEKYVWCCNMFLVWVTSMILSFLIFVTLESSYTLIQSAVTGTFFNHRSNYSFTHIFTCIFILEKIYVKKSNFREIKLQKLCWRSAINLFGREKGKIPGLRVMSKGMLCLTLSRIINNGIL